MDIQVYRSEVLTFRMPLLAAFVLAIYGYIGLNVNVVIAYARFLYVVLLCGYNTMDMCCWRVHGLTLHMIV